MTLGACHAGSIHQSGVALSCENLGNAAAHSTGTKYCDFHVFSSYNILFNHQANLLINVGYAYLFW